ncbi:membrane lipoprotein lipid attachment site-containing protein [Serratia liquefaciens]|uniref:membrane lipoprotein lipid attachment site-containing protein n=1 Tax=Serratia liquefaciens TaxID=614 RepID=UPI0021C7ABB4|nr:membrane lipoprotein lipid attachment site-containing protein [Serratia liquefaciens]
MRKIIIFISAFFMLAGCATDNGTYVTIDALSSGKSIGKKYIVLPAKSELQQNDQLYYAQVEGYLDRVLRDKGYQKVQDKQVADQAVFLNYWHDGGVSNTRDEVVPIWGETGVSSSTTYGTVTPSYGGGGRINATTTYTPSYGVTGAVSRKVTDTYFSSGFRVESYDASELRSGKEVSLWRTSATSTATDLNDRRDIKMLFFISRQYFGENLSEKQSGFAKGDGSQMNAYFQ